MLPAGSAGPAPEPPEWNESDTVVDEITLRDVYLILRRHLALVIGLPLLFAVIAGASTLLSPAAYQAEATLVVQQALLQSRLYPQHTARRRCTGQPAA